MNSFNRSYGLDLFSMLLILISSIFNLFNSTYTHLLSGVVLIYALYRMLSKNFQKRQQEYRKFIMYVNRILSKFNRSIPNNIQPLHLSDLGFTSTNLKKRFNEKKNYKIVKCPECNQKLRLPRHKGKITVTCKKCFHEFKMKS